MTIHVVFVCLGNICRSPSAQGIFESHVAAAELQHRISVDSCGTAAFNVGKNPDPRAIAACSRRGYDIQQQIARQIDDDDFHRAHYLLGMDAMNMRNLRAWTPANFNGEINLFKHYSTYNKKAEIPDPYYGEESQFDRVIDILEEASQSLLDYIIHNHNL